MKVAERHVITGRNPRHSPTHNARRPIRRELGEAAQETLSGVAGRLRVVASIDDLDLEDLGPDRPEAPAGEVVDELPDAHHGLPDARAPRARRRAEALVDAGQHPPQPLGAVGRQQSQALGIASGAEPLERSLEGLATQDGRSRVLELAEARIETGRERMGTEQTRAEAVDRRDPRVVELERQIRAAALEQARPDPGAKLAGGTLGVRYDEHRVDIDAVVDDRANEALDEHGRLAGPGAGGDEDVTRRLDRSALLLVRPRAHARSFRHIRHRSHQGGQSPPCGS